jgi:hypothetical protein
MAILRNHAVLLACGLLATWNVTGQSLPPGSPADPLSTWSFSDTAEWSDDLGYKALSYQNITNSALGDGTDLVVNSASPAWLTYNVIEDDGTTNLTLNLGSITLWFAPLWSGTNMGGSGPGTWGRLIEAGAYTTNASYGSWSLYTDPWGGNVYFSAQSNDGSQATYLSAPISWATNDWHLLTLTYSSTNTALYLDGTLATNGPGLTVLPPPSALTNGFSIGSSGDGSNQSHGMCDDIATYAYVLSASTISNWYKESGIQYWLNNLNPVNLAPAPSYPTNTPNFNAIAGPGYLVNMGSIANCISNSAVWITNAVATLTTNGTVSLEFTIEGGSNGLPYDVFASPGLVGNSLSNGVWTWMGQGYQCNSYMLTNLPGPAAFIVLGTPLDSDGDGLTDAYELLVSKTGPHTADTSGDGMLDGWKVLWGMNPLINNVQQAGQRANYSYSPVGWLEQLTGLHQEAISPDAEGNVLSDGQ